MKNCLLITTCLLFAFITVEAQTNKSNYTRVVVSPDNITANTPLQINIYVVVDSVPLQKHTQVKLIFPKEFTQFAFDNNPPPFPPLPSLQRGYCRSYGNRGLKASIVSMKLTRDEFIGSFPYNGYKHDDNEYLMTIKLDTLFDVGDTLILSYGYGSSINYVIPPNISFRSAFKSMIDFDRNGTYTYQQQSGSIVSKPKKADALQLILSSTGKKNQPALLKAVIFDDNVSAVPYFTGSFRITCTDASASYSSTVQFTESDSGHVEIPVTFRQPGIFTCNAQQISGSSTITKIYASNPINISEDSMQIYWGEFHTHTEYSRDGQGQDAFKYAKNAVGLDFFAQTDHSDGNNEFGLDSGEWNAILQNVILYNQPGRFVTFMGFENSMNTPSGHYNTIFNAPDSLLSGVPNLSKMQYNSVQRMWAKLDSMDDRIEAITIPHHSGKIFSVYPTPVCNFCNTFGGAYVNTKYKMLAEVYSGHGLCESYNPQHALSYENLNATTKSNNGSNYFQDALALREKLGIIASSDNHLARATQKQFGSFAVIADSLERNNIFFHIKNRHTYATTGERIALKFTINNHLMGDELSVECDDYPELKIEVNGTDVLDYIQVLKWDFKNGTYTADIHPNFSIIKTYSINGNSSGFKDSLVDGFLTDSSVYYIRVKQKNKIDDREVWAWSSPIWVNKVSCPAPPKDVLLPLDATDSSSGNQYKIHVAWSVRNQVNTDHFILERSHDNNRFSAYAIINAAGEAGDSVAYTYIDSFPDNNVLYYRVRMVSFFDSVNYSNMDSVRIRFGNDTIRSFSAVLQNDGVKIDWTGSEFLSNRYEVNRAPIRNDFTVIDSRMPIYGDELSRYSFLDELPLKDSSVYNIIMKFPNGTFKLSRTDTVYFVMDSIIDFYTQLLGDTVLIAWKGVHEHKTSFYEVQKSMNRIAYTTLETVIPQGGVFDTVSYIRYDKLPLPGINYYKITQTITGDFDHFSSLDSQRIVTSGIHTDFPKNFSIKVLNPFMHEGQMDLNIMSASASKVSGSFLVVDVMGRVLYNEQATIPSGEGHFIIPSSSFASNVYFLLFKSEDILVKHTFYILDEH